jgi:ribosomal protein S18 acetylase RimI-like enzyme
MFTNRMKKLTFIGAIIVALSGYGLYQYQLYNSAVLYDFNAERDTPQMLEMFESDWYWLFASSPEEFSVAHSLKYLTPSQYDRRYFGALKIKVMRQRERVLGFVAYYMHNATKGQLLWLDVRPETRGKGYGYMLAQHAVDQMIAAGAKTIFIWTRTSNIPGQKIYKKLGFKEVYVTEDGYVYFEYVV